MSFWHWFGVYCMLCIIVTPLMLMLFVHDCDETIHEDDRVEPTLPYDPAT